jgi:TonB family protein
VRRQQKSIRRCYRDVLQLFKTVGGDVVVEFEVASDGTVARARVHRNTTGSKTLAACLTDVFLDMRFPQPPGGPATLRYPLRFNPRRK